MILSLIRQPAVDKEFCVDSETTIPSIAEHYRQFIQLHGKQAADEAFGISDSSFDQTYSRVVLKALEVMDAEDKLIDAYAVQINVLNARIAETKRLAALIPHIQITA